jgi:hypothetical protein
MADTNASVFNFLIVGLMAFLFIVLGKWLANRFDIPGLKDLFNYV